MIKEMLRAAARRSKTAQKTKSKAPRPQLELQRLESRELFAADVAPTMSLADELGPVGPTAIVRSEAVGSRTDVDMYRFTAAAGQRVGFDIDTPTNGPAGLGSYLRLFDANGRELAANNDRLAPGDPSPSPGAGVNGFDSYIEYDFSQGGTYYIGVSNWQNRSYNPANGVVGRISDPRYLTGSYNLVVTATQVDDHGNDFGAATSLALGSSGGGSMAGNIERSGDQDMIRIVATQTGKMTLTQNATPGSRLDAYLYVYDGSRNMLASNDDSNGSLNSRVTVDFVAGQTYYVRADAYGSSSGRYQLAFSTEFVDDHGNDFGAATPFALSSSGGGSIAGNIERAGDQDMIRIVATRTGRMTLTQNATPGSGLDAYLYVYDGSRNMLASNDDRNGSLNSSVTIDVVAGQTYYVRADAYGSSSGRYQLAFSTELTRGSRRSSAIDEAFAAR